MSTTYRVTATADSGGQTVTQDFTFDTEHPHSKDLVEIMRKLDGQYLTMTMIEVTG